MSSPPVRMVAVPQTEMPSWRRWSPWSCRWRSSSRLADWKPRRQAVGVGRLRTSTVKKLRPVGSTSRRPRLGAPLGPGGTKRPSRAASTPPISAPPQASRVGAITLRRLWMTASLAGPREPKSRVSIRPWANSSRRSRVSPLLRQGSGLSASSTAGRGPSQGSAQFRSRGSVPSPRSLARARSRLALTPLPSPRGMRTSDSRVSLRRRPAGDSPNTWRPSRICDSLRSQR
ncbi:hypothetical protein D9M71_568060 [compost metagenome]